MKENYTVRILSSEDITDLEMLFTAAFNQAVKDNFFRWKYFENPCGEALLAGAFLNGELVGSGAMMPETVNYLGESMTVYKCTDLMTHPNHQQKGVSKLINALLNEELLKTNASFSYTLCSQMATKSFVKNNWEHVEVIANFFKPAFLLKRSLLNKKSEVIKHFDAVGNVLDSYLFTSPANKISLSKTSEFIKWRTLNPDYTYKLLGHYNESGELDGYLIYSLSTNNMVNIIDFDAPTERIIKSLVKELEYISRSNKYKAVLMMALKNSEQARFFKKLGYIRNPFKKGPLKTILDFNTKTENNKTGLSLNDPGIWDIKAINYDDI